MILLLFWGSTTSKCTGPSVSPSGPLDTAFSCQPPFSSKKIGHPDSNALEILFWDILDVCDCCKCVRPRRWSEQFSRYLTLTLYVGP